MTIWHIDFHDKLSYHLCEVKKMPDYEKMYFTLMAKIADVIDELIEIQQKCEDMYIEGGEDEE